MDIYILLVEMTKDEIRNLIRSEIINFKTELLASVSSAIDLKLTPMNNNISKINTDTNELLKSQNFIAEKYEEISTLIKGIHTEFSTLQTKVTDHESRINNMEAISAGNFDRINQLEQKLMNNNIIISNLVKLPNENLLSSFQAICANLGLNPSKNDIMDIRRITTKNKGEIEPVLVRLDNHHLKGDIMRASKTKNVFCNDIGISIPQKIYFNHQLTIYNLRTLQAARKFVKAEGWAFSWFSTNTNRVMVKKERESTKAHIIIQESDLYKLKQVAQ